MTPNATANTRGLDGVVAAQTRLSHVDGQNGVLIIAGYSVEDLAARATFEEGAHLCGEIACRLVKSSRSFRPTWLNCANCLRSHWK